METQRYQEHDDLIGKSQVFTGTYIKNGIDKGSETKTILINSVTLDGVEVLDHVWLKDSKKSFADVLKKKQHKRIKFIGKLVKVTKPYTLYETKTDLGLKITKLL